MKQIKASKKRHFLGHNSFQWINHFLLISKTWQWKCRSKQKHTDLWYLTAWPRLLTGPSWARRWFPVSRPPASAAARSRPAAPRWSARAPPRLPLHAAPPPAACRVGRGVGRRFSTATLKEEIKISTWIYKFRLSLLPKTRDLTLTSFGTLALWKALVFQLCHAQNHWFSVWHFTKSMSAFLFVFSQKLAVVSYFYIPLIAKISNSLSSESHPFSGIRDPPCRVALRVVISAWQSLFFFISVSPPWRRWSECWRICSWYWRRPGFYAVTLPTQISRPEPLPASPQSVPVWLAVQPAVVGK